MLHDSLRTIAEAQLSATTRVHRSDASELSILLERSLTPAEVRRTLIRELPVVRRLPDLGDADPPIWQLRERAFKEGTLATDQRDLEFRRLYPTLDLGVYAASHATGIPSAALIPAVQEHLSLLPAMGFHAFDDGGWLELLDSWRGRISELVGDADLSRGDVMAFTSFSDGLSAVLGAGRPGRLLTTEDHFTSAHYVHEQWASRTDSEVRVVAAAGDSGVSTERLCEALTPQTAIVSISHGAWRTGRLVDLVALGEAMMDVCPDAALILDVYQTLGTVPVAVDLLPPRTAVLGGGLKQLRAGPGTGFGWFSAALLEELRPQRTGWWAHRAPMDFAPPPLEPAAGAGRFRTGTPSLLPMLCLWVELEVFATSGGGSLDAAVRRARRATQDQVQTAAMAARASGLQVVGGLSADDRAAFFAVRTADGPRLLSGLHRDGIVIDFRPDVPGGEDGVLRISANAASFAYELLFAVERLVALS